MTASQAHLSAFKLALYCSAIIMLWFALLLNYMLFCDGQWVIEIIPCSFMALITNKNAHETYCDSLSCLMFIPNDAHQSF